MQTELLREIVSNRTSKTHNSKYSAFLSSVMRTGRRRDEKYQCTVSRSQTLFSRRGVIAFSISAPREKGLGELANNKL